MVSIFCVNILVQKFFMEDLKTDMDTVVIRVQYFFFSRKFRKTELYNIIIPLLHLNGIGAQLRFTIEIYFFSNLITTRNNYLMLFQMYLFIEIH